MHGTVSNRQGLSRCQVCKLGEGKMGVFDRRIITLSLFITLLLSWFSVRQEFGITQVCIMQLNNVGTWLVMTE